MNPSHSIKIPFETYKSVEVCPVPFSHSYINGKDLIFNLVPTAITNLGKKTSNNK